MLHILDILVQTLNRSKVYQCTLDQQDFQFHTLITGMYPSCEEG